MADRFAICVNCDPRSIATAWITGPATWNGPTNVPTTTPTSSTTNPNTADTSGTILSITNRLYTGAANITTTPINPNSPITADEYRNGASDSKNDSVVQNDVNTALNRNAITAACTNNGSVTNSLPAPVTRLTYTLPQYFHVL